MHSKYRLLTTALLCISWLAQAQAPQIGGLVELRGMLNARHELSDGQVDFRKTTKNRLYALNAGSRGKITSVKLLQSGNYGLKVKLINVIGAEEEVWVYYKPSQNPSDVKLYSAGDARSEIEDTETTEKIWITEAASQKNQIPLAHKYNDIKYSEGSEVKNPTRASDLLVQRNITALGDKSVSASDTEIKATQLVSTTSTSAKSTKSTGPAPSSSKNKPQANIEMAESKQVDNEGTARLATQKIKDANVQVKQAGNTNLGPGENCLDCKPKNSLVSQVTCNEKNDYFEKLIRKNSDLPVIQVLNSSEPKSTKLMSCIETEMARADGRFIDCDSGLIGKNVPKACLSYDYKRIAANSFEMVNDCLGAYALGLNSNEEMASKNYKSLLYSTIAHESGFHMNILPNSYISKSDDGRSFSPIGADKMKDLKNSGRWSDLLSSGDIRPAVDAGMGQLTGAAINLVNGGVWKKSANFSSLQTWSMKKVTERSGINYFEDLIRFAGKSSSTSCQNLKRLDLEEIKDRGSQRCEALSLKNGNPALNLVYTLALAKANRVAFLNDISITPSAKKNWNKLSSSTQNLIANYMVSWSHHHPMARTNVLQKLSEPKALSLLLGGKESDVEKFFMSVPSQKKAYISSIIYRKNTRGQQCVN